MLGRTGGSFTTLVRREKVCENFRNRRRRWSLSSPTGLTGTEKNYFSRRLAERIPVSALESDTLRRVFSRYWIGSEESTQKFCAIHRWVEEVLASGTFLVRCDTSLAERLRESLYANADRISAQARGIGHRLGGGGVDALSVYHAM